jgi:hypothetical protein
MVVKLIRANTDSAAVDCLISPASKEKARIAAGFIFTTRTS